MTEAESYTKTLEALLSTLCSYFIDGQPTNIDLLKPLNEWWRDNRKTSKEACQKEISFISEHLENLKRNYRDNHARED